MRRNARGNNYVNDGNDFLYKDHTIQRLYGLYMYGNDCMAIRTASGFANFDIFKWLYFAYTLTILDSYLGLHGMKVRRTLFSPSSRDQV